MIARYFGRVQYYIMQVHVYKMKKKKVGCRSDDKFGQVKIKKVLEIVSFILTVLVKYRYVKQYHH